jgi:hypothetical protein
VPIRPRMAEHLEGPVDADDAPSAPPPPESPSPPAADRAAELWKLLGVDEETAAAEAGVGELVARAWYDADPDAGRAADRDGTGQPGAAWTVDRLPTAAEGGVAAMFTAGAEGPGRAQLSAMIEGLPDQPLPRVTPDDIDIERPSVGPVAVWFWGDDDIYPGRSASTARPGQEAADRTAKPRRHR